MVIISSRFCPDGVCRNRKIADRLRYYSAFNCRFQGEYLQNLLKLKKFTYFGLKYKNMGSRSSPCQNPALAVLHPIMTCTNGRWDAAPGHYCSQHPSIVKAWTGGLQTEQEI